MKSKNTLIKKYLKKPVWNWVLLTQNGSYFYGKYASPITFHKSVTHIEEFVKFHGQTKKENFGVVHTNGTIFNYTEAKRILKLKRI